MMAIYIRLFMTTVDALTSHYHKAEEVEATLMHDATTAARFWVADNDPGVVDFDQNGFWLPPTQVWRYEGNNTWVQYHYDSPLLRRRNIIYSG